jgi:hypothetical protein
MCLALAVGHAERMRRITLSSETSPHLQCFPTLSHKQLNFMKDIPEHKMCVLRFYITFFCNIYLSKNNLAMH